MRTPKETCELIEKTISEINRKTSKSNPINDELIESICKKNQISESTIRNIAGWKKEYKPRMSTEEMTRIRQAKALLRKHKMDF